MTDSEMNLPSHKTFDVMGRVLRVTDQLSRIYETSYDKDGNATSLLLHDYRSQATGDFPRDIFVERSTYDAASRS